MTNRLPPPHQQFKKLTLSVAVALALSSSAVLASKVIVDSGSTYNQNIDKTVTKIENNGTIKNDSFVFEGEARDFINKGTIETNMLDLYIKNPDSQYVLDGTIFAKEELIFRGQGNTARDILFVGKEIKTPKLSIVSGTGDKRAGLLITEGSAIQDIDEIYVKSNGPRTGLYLEPGSKDGISYDKTVYLMSGGDARIEVFGNVGEKTNINANYYVKNVVVDNVVNGTDIKKGRLQITNEGEGIVTFAVDDIHIKNGYLNLQTNSSLYDNDVDSLKNKYSGKFELNNVTLDAGTSLRAVAYTYFDNKGNIKTNTPSFSIEGDVAFNLASGAIVDFGGYANSDWLPDFITVAANSIIINIDNSKNGGNHFYISKNTRKTDPSNIHVVAASGNNTGNAVDDLGRLVYIVQTNYKDENLENHLECLPGVVLIQSANDMYDEVQGVVEKGELDGNGDCVNCSVSVKKTTDNPNVHGIAEMTALGLHVWRNEIDDMHRRLGELRDSSDQDNGLWTRVYNGRASFGGQDITNKYTAFQFGYDHQTSPGLWLGGALSYTYGDNSFNHGSGDSNLFAFTGYASRLYDNGIYLDFTGKIGRMKNSFDIRFNDIDSSGEYHTNAVSLSAEAGWRFYPAENVFVEPQLEIWYGHVFDAQYETSTNVLVDQSSTDSLVGRAGVRIGVKCPNNRGAAFIKASVLHDWEGDASFRFSKADFKSRTITEDLGGTWYEYGIGADYNATNQLSFWGELERGDGGEVDTDYRATVGMRYTW